MAKKRLCQGFGRDIKWTTEQEKELLVCLYTNWCPTNGSGLPYMVQQKLIGIVESYDHLVTIRYIRLWDLVEIIELVELRNLALRKNCSFQ